MNEGSNLGGAEHRLRLSKPTHCLSGIHPDWWSDEDSNLNGTSRPRGYSPVPFQMGVHSKMAEVVGIEPTRRFTSRPLGFQDRGLTSRPDFHLWVGALLCAVLCRPLGPPQAREQSHVSHRLRELAPVERESCWWAATCNLGGALLEGSVAATPYGSSSNQRKEKSPPSVIRAGLCVGTRSLSPGWPLELSSAWGARRWLFARQTRGMVSPASLPPWISLACAVHPHHSVPGLIPGSGPFGGVRG